MMEPDVLGIIYKPTGKTLTDSAGFNYPEMRPITGWYVNFPGEVPELAQHKMSPQPTTPNTLYAGGIVPFCYVFSDEDEFRALWTEDLAIQKASEERKFNAMNKRRQSMRVTRFQALAALHEAGLLNNIEAVVSTSSDPLVKLAWQEASFERLSPFVSQMQSAIGLTDEQLDHLFESAATIK